MWGIVILPKSEEYNAIGWLVDGLCCAVQNELPTLGTLVLKDGSMVLKLPS